MEIKTIARRGESPLETFPSSPRLLSIQPRLQ